MRTLDCAALAALGSALLLEARAGSAFPLFGSREASPIPLILVATAALGAAVSPHESSRLGARTVGPLFALLCLLPVLGVAFNEYPGQTVYAAIVPLAALAMVRVGRFVGAAGRLRDWLLFAVILVHGVYSLGQSMYRVGVLPATVWAPAVNWDIQSQLALSEAYVQTGRSTGLFINPNSFALWSVLALVYSWRYFKGWQRSSAIALSVAGVLASQSRTGIAALVVVTVVLALLLLSKKHVMIRPGVVIAGVVSLAVAPLAIALLGPVLLTEDLGERVQTAVGIVGQDGPTDANFAARTSAWEELLASDYNHSFGTFGPPQVETGSLIDNQFVHFYLQGGVILVAAFLLALSSPFRMKRQLAPPDYRALCLMAVVILLFALTSPVVSAGTLASGFLWLTVGRATLERRTPETYSAQLPTPRRGAFNG